MAFESGFDLDEAVDIAMENAKKNVGSIKSKVDAIIERLKEEGIMVRAEDIEVVDISNMPDDESGFKAKLREFIDEIEKKKAAKASGFSGVKH
jgi:hypothetical protein